MVWYGEVRHVSLYLKWYVFVKYTMFSAFAVSALICLLLKTVFAKL